MGPFEEDVVGLIATDDDEKPEKFRGREGPGVPSATQIGVAPLKVDPPPSEPNPKNATLLPLVAACGPRRNPPKPRKFPVPSGIGVFRSTTFVTAAPS